MSDEINQLKATGIATGGTFTLTVNTHTTTSLAYNASLTAIQNAIAALSGIGTGNVSVTGALLSAAALGPVVRFTGRWPSRKSAWSPARRR